MGGSGDSIGVGCGVISGTDIGLVPFDSPTTHFSDLLRLFANSSAPSKNIVLTEDYREKTGSTFAFW